MYILQSAPDGSPGESLIGLVVLCLIIYFIVKAIGRQISFVTATQPQYFEGMHYSPQKFYSEVSRLINEKEIPGVKLSYIFHQVGGIFAGKRQYLRVTYKEFFFDICAAPFAKDFFISWRQGGLRRLQFGRKRKKTFYEEDSEAMFRASIELCVKKVMSEITEAQGIRKAEVFA